MTLANVTPRHSPEQTLPHLVTRPLWIGFWAIIVTLAVFSGWAVLAPLATSIPATGHLDGRLPSLDIQHRFGGKIASVFVAPHDRVQKGQLLIKLDTSDAEAELQELQAALAPMLEERRALVAALAGTLTSEETESLSPQARLALHRMKAKRDVLDFGAKMSHQLETSLQFQTEQHRASMEALLRRENSMQARLERYAKLAAQGALRTADRDALQESILDVQASLSRERADLASQESQFTQAKLQVTRDKLEFRQEILDRQAQLEEAIPQLRLQALRLSTQIEQAVIRAPDDGVVTALPYDTAAMVVAQGDTIATLARPSEKLNIALLASPQAIDQLRVGMEGFLTVTGLPQRNHPRVRISLVSLSPEARRDREGTVVGYDGIAVMNSHDEKNLRHEMGAHLNLASDMPVHLVFIGRHLTFADYLLGPFVRFLSQAMQD